DTAYSREPARHRDLAIWQGGRADPRGRVATALPADALSLLPRVPDVPDRRAVHACLVHGLPGRSSGGRTHGRIYVRTGFPCRAGARPGGNQPARVPACRDGLVRLV